MNAPAYRSVNPTTGELLDEYPHITAEDLSAALAAADEAFGSWAARPIEERAEVARRVSEVLRERGEDLAAQVTREMGKPAPEAAGEAELAADIFAYYAEHGPEFAAEQVLSDTDKERTVLQHLPVGPLLGIMPWNYPLYQVARFVAPNLVLGNTILLKHAESTPGCALAIEAALREAGVPEGVYRNIFAGHEQVSEVIADPRIQGVSLTGSERAGAAVAEQAGRHLKKAVLELGGSDPWILLSSDDVEKDAAKAVGVRLENAGQACNSNKRIIVSADIYDRFVDAVIARVAGLSPGDPADGEEDTYGPLSSRKAADTIEEQLTRAVSAGAQLRIGGERLVEGAFGDGFYVSPAVLTDVPRGSDIYYEEFFGPVITIFRVESDEEALELANDTQYGLGSTVYATEPGRAEAVGEKLRAGMTGVNGAAPESEDMPFGGVKRSGYGRELGPVGMDEFVNKRLYSVRKA